MQWPKEQVDLAIYGYTFLSTELGREDVVVVGVRKTPKKFTLSFQFRNEFPGSLFCFPIPLNPDLGNFTDELLTPKYASTRFYSASFPNDTEDAENTNSLALTSKIVGSTTTSATVPHYPPMVKLDESLSKTEDNPSQGLVWSNPGSYLYVFSQPGAKPVEKVVGFDMVCFVLPICLLMFRMEQLLTQKAAVSSQQTALIGNGGMSQS